MRRERGAILVLVLAVLGMMAILAGAFAHSARLRVLEAREFEHLEACRALADGGERAGQRATIDDGAKGASSNEGTHGPQTIPPGGDCRLGYGTGRQGHREDRARR
ncbi:hypothetical protein [Luteibacter sp. UNCMF366Tsu5.1]|uniref:hypothetical protein n=1 Tax=Luteibacter sp. UNCMF366Tsu5.1 TaxID=1502758 RepID=UPI0009085A46|nr:hypothetical protein [Luteibacter sp. UNCMF366Tsu5.1]SFW19875.1 hypothetical protein SAMN02800691_0226 [Luteibacter sp. UNCMF366Tsu5.1]